MGSGTDVAVSQLAPLSAPVTQSAVVQMLRPPFEVRRARVEQVLRGRAGRWDPERPEYLVREIFRFAAARPPLELLSAILRTIVYAW